MKKPEEIKPAEGKLGVLLPGFGAVATTFVAGIEAAREGLAKPIGFAYADEYNSTRQAER